MVKLVPVPNMVLATPPEFTQQETPGHKVQTNTEQKVSTTTRVY